MCAPEKGGRERDSAEVGRSFHTCTHTASSGVDTVNKDLYSSEHSQVGLHRVRRAKSLCVKHVCCRKQISSLQTNTPGTVSVSTLKSTSALSIDEFKFLLVCCHLPAHSVRWTPDCCSTWCAKATLAMSLRVTTEFEVVLAVLLSALSNYVGRC